MLIIVEGADCTGKSTLISALKDAIDQPVTLLGKGPPTSRNAVVEYLWPLAGYAPGSGEHIICDRWHLGEMIYPEIFHRNSIMTSAQFDFIHGTLMHLGALVVYLEPPLSTVHARFNARGDKLIKNIDQLNESYFQFRTFTTRFQFSYDPRAIRFSNVEFGDDVIKGILWTAQMREAAYDDD